MAHQGNLPYQPPSNFFICPVMKRDMAIQTYSNKRDFYQFNPHCLTPVQPPTPSTPINSNDQTTSSDSSSFYSSYLNYPIGAGSSSSGGRTTRKKRVMWTETEVNALREGVRICGAGNWVDSDDHRIGSTQAGVPQILKTSTEPSKNGDTILSDFFLLEWVNCIIFCIKFWVNFCFLNS